MPIRLRFHGAARTVTGSCYLLENEKARVLIDCGMFQGSKTETELNYRPFPFDPAALSAMLLTHAHIDHTGMIPKLVKHGYAGKIHCTPPTVDLCGIMLPDSGFIQESEVRQLNERKRKRGQEEVEPIYTFDDAMKSLENFSGVAYETWIEPAPGIRARYWNAGHLMGSASIEVEVAREGLKPLRILFSGDIGPDNKMLEEDPEAPVGWDFVICESTYGGRDRFERSEEGRREIMAKEVNDAAQRKGALLIPSFAVERTQELVTDLVLLMEQKKIPQANIFIDSPLASKATAIFSKYAKSLQHGDDLYRAFHSSYVRATESVEDSKALARFSGFHIVIAASGMCEAGRITPPEESSVAGLDDGAAGRLPGRRFARPHPRGWRQERHHHGRADHSQSLYPPHRGLFGPRRRAGTGAVDEGTPAGCQDGVPHPLRRTGPDRP